MQGEKFGDTQKKTHKGFCKCNDPDFIAEGGVGDDWHVLPEDYAKLVIEIHKNNPDAAQTIEHWKELIANKHDIRVPYNHPLLKLTSQVMKDLGAYADAIKMEYYKGNITKQDYDDISRKIGCRQSCSIAKCAPFLVLLLHSSLLNTPRSTPRSTPGQLPLLRLPLSLFHHRPYPPPPHRSTPHP